MKLGFDIGIIHHGVLPAVALYLVAFGIASEGQINRAAVTPVAAASTYVPSLIFDVASIRESHHDDSSYSEGLLNPLHSSRFDAQDIRVSQLIGEAYDVNYRFQIKGGPDWINLTRFNVHAKSDTRVDEQLSRLDDDDAKLEKQHMLQLLLAERFHLICHKEMRHGSVYILSLAKTKPKLTVSHVPFSGSEAGIRSTASSLGVELEAHGGTINNLAGLLSYYLKSTVIDQTGLNDKYNFVLRFNSALSPLQADTSSIWPSAEKAVPEQLGLNITLTKGPVGTIIVDKADKPSAN